MATLNFDNLPTQNPFGIAETGPHYAVIDKAEVLKTKAGAEYIAVSLSLTHAFSGAKIKHPDNFYTESDNEFVRYKFGRFISVLALGLTGEVDKNLLVKVLPGRKLGVLIKHKEETYNGNTTTKAEVDIFKNGYFTSEEFQSMVARTQAEQASAPSAPAPDATQPAPSADVNPEQTTEEDPLF